MRWPNANKLTEMVLTVTPDTGYWKGASYEFNISVPPDYPHKPPKVTCATKVCAARVVCAVCCVCGTRAWQ